MISYHSFFVFTYFYFDRCVPISALNVAENDVLEDGFLIVWLQNRIAHDIGSNPKSSLSVSKVLVLSGDIDDG